MFYIILTATLEAPAASVPLYESVIPVTEKTPPSFAGYKAIIQRNLFNMQMGAGQKPQTPALETLAQTELNVKLWGTVTGNDGKPYAVIEEARGKQQSLFRVGDTIKNATVKMILREKVVLRVKGKDEILEMEKVRSKGTGPLRGPRRVARVPTPPIVQRIILKRDQIEAAMKDPGAVGKGVRLRPHFTNGAPDGILITGIRPRSIFRRSGLRNGDIVTGLDDEAVEAPEDALQFFQDILESDSGTIRIKRRGRVRTINYSVE